MAAYSMDLRKRVLRAWDTGLDAENVAAKYEVQSRSSPVRSFRSSYHAHETADAYGKVKVVSLSF